MKKYAVILLLLPVFSASAKDLGSYGHTYPVQEKSLLTLIYERIHALKGSKDLSEFQEKIQEQARRKILRPNPLGLPQTQKYRRFYYDPSIRVPQDIRDTSGVLIAAAGTRINPFDQLPSYQPHWLFLNFDEPMQREFAITLLKKYSDTHIILTGGNIYDAEQVLDHPIYFDQMGALTKRFGIQQVPAWVSRSGDKLSIEELLAEGEVPHA